jgi:uncharacterized membrane-anchored protein YhcB (DUF1043 family)
MIQCTSFSLWMALILGTVCGTAIGIVLYRIAIAVDEVVKNRRDK